MTDVMQGLDKQVVDRFTRKDRDIVPRLPSTAGQPERVSRSSALIVPLEKRGKMPLTKEKFLVKENPELVLWERETRNFLVNLSLANKHRIAAVMVYEWATNTRIADVVAGGGTASPQLRLINRVLRHYFMKYGKPYATYICGRQVKQAFKVPANYYITRHAPMTMELYAEYLEGSLRP
jgi:hypothetical protein